MAKEKFYITTAIPYINAAPHIGHTWEFVLTDVLARYQRECDRDVWFLTGTDDNSLKNVQAAEKKGIPVKKLVDENSESFLDMTKYLNISNDDFIRTVEERHTKGAEKLWKACEKDIYKKKYSGLYCVGCEEFKREADLIDGCCPEHPKDKLEHVEEENYFFKLSKYQKELEKIIESDKYQIHPASRKNEVLSFIRAGLEDFSISRSKERAKGWGIPVPGDETQVIYVWFDALANYITALDYATDGAKFKKYWPADFHVVGKGIIKFHAIYWPAMLLSGGVELPKNLFVHEYLTVNGQKISKSIGNTINPKDLVQKYGTDAVRYYLLRESPFRDSDFTYKKFEEKYTADLSNDLGNLLQRTLTMINKYEVKVGLPGELSIDVAGPKGKSIRDDVGAKIEALRFDEALEEIWKIIRDLNVEIDRSKPWEVKDEKKLSEILSFLYENLYGIAELLIPFVPSTAENIKQQLKTLEPKPLFPRTPDE